MKKNPSIGWKNVFWIFPKEIVPNLWDLVKEQKIDILRPFGREEREAQNLWDLMKEQKIGMLPTFYRQEREYQICEIW